MNTPLDARPRFSVTLTLVLALLSLLMLVPVATGQDDLPAPTADADAARLSIDRLHDTDDFRTEGLGRLRWLEDGSGYTTVERGAEGGQAIVHHDPESGATRVLVSAAQLTPPGAERGLGVADYRWSEDGRRLLVMTNTRRVWRAHTRGDFWVLDLETDALRRIGGELEQTWFQFAKLDPAGERVAYVHRHDLYVENLETGVQVRLTDSGSDTVTNGTFDWVYEEELSLRDGFRWSPDGARIAFWQLDASEIRKFAIVDYTEDLYPTFKEFAYPKVGTVNPRCRVGVTEADGASGVRWLELPGDERDDYVARMEWASSSDELVVQRINRRQNENRVLLVDVHSGAVREAYRDEDDAWVEVCDDLVWLDGGTRFTFASERDGWRHVYVVPRDGGEPRLVTPGPYDVTSVVRIDEAGGYVYFIASPDNPTRRYLYRVPLAGGAAERLTPEDQPGTHGYDIAPNAAYAVHTHSSFGVPERVELVSLPDHAVMRTLVSNDRARAALEAVERGPMQFYRVPVDEETSVDGYAIFPPEFDPERKYPLLVYVYGEPAGQTVMDAWGGGYYLWHLMLAQQGYIVASFDNRGTPSPRGRAWRKSIYGQIGILAAQDQAAAVRSILERWPFVDAERVGSWGWSGGGSMTLNALFRYPELYRAGIAIAFVANQRLYDTIYQERYMGLPEDNPDGYEQGSPITHAHRLEGDLLLVYGTGDDNCHYQNCAVLIDELVRHGKPFEMMAYPGRSHGIHEKEGTRKHLFSMMTAFLLEHLPPGPRDR